MRLTLLPESVPEAHPMRMCRVALVLLALSVSPVEAGTSPALILLAAPFNEQPLNQQIGTGGAALGQPVEISGGLQAFVVPAGVFTTPALRIRPVESGGARFVRFELLGSEEVVDGEVRFGFALRPTVLDRFLVYVREPDGATRDFLSMTLMASGQISVSDQSGNSAVIGSYVPGVRNDFEIRFRMSGGRYDIYRNGVPLALDRVHGISDRGVGALLLGTDPSSSVGTDWFVDDVYAYRPDQMYADGFE